MNCALSPPIHKYGRNQQTWHTPTVVLPQDHYDQLTRMYKDALGKSQCILNVFAESANANDIENENGVVMF